MTRTRTSLAIFSDRLPPLTVRAWLRYDVVTRLIERLNPSNLLEIGCGQGALGARLASRVDYVGVEPDRVSYQLAVSRIEPRGGTVLNGTHEMVPQHSTFDVVCAFEVLEHIDNDSSALAAWVSFIRPGGHLLLSVPAFQDRYAAMDEYAGHFRRYSPDHLHDRIRAAGLTDDEMIIYGWPLGYALETVHNRIAARTLAASGAARTSVAQRTARSGRYIQPTSGATGAVVWAATLPFRYLQRLRPQSGTCLIAIAKLPRIVGPIESLTHHPVRAEGF